MAALIALGTGIGPVLAGWIRDQTGDYTMFLIAGIIGSLVSGLLILTMPRYPVWEKRTAAEPAAA